MGRRFSSDHAWQCSVIWLSHSEPSPLRMSAHAAGYPTATSAARGAKYLVGPRQVMACKLLFLDSSTAVT